MSSEEKASVRLRIAETKQKEDVGRSIARIDSDAMKAVGVTVGDVIEIQGKKVTPAKVWPAYPEDQGQGLIRIDGFIRKNCGASLDEDVTVLRAKVESASYVTLAPVDTRISVDNDFVRFVKDRLIDCPMTQGDTILIRMLGHSIPFIVAITWPSGIVNISKNTTINIMESIEQLAKPISPTISREDRRHLRFRCLKWAEKMYAADETWFYIPDREERSKDETTIIKTARQITSEEEKSSRSELSCSRRGAP